MFDMLIVFSIACFVVVAAVVIDGIFLEYQK